MAYKIKFYREAKGKSKSDIYISKKQAKELSKLTKGKDVEGVIVYLEK